MSVSSTPSRKPSSHRKVSSGIQSSRTSSNNVQRASGTRSNNLARPSSQNPPKISQDQLKEDMRAEVEDATWELPTQALSRALSAKVRERGKPLIVDSQNTDDFDTLDNYDVALDKLDDVLDIAVEELKLALEREPIDFPSDTGEKAHYVPLATFFNLCLDVCRKAAKCDDTHYYNGLRFIKWDRVTKDGVQGASALKPDVAGGYMLNVDTKELWWRPKSHEHRSFRLEIPVEVKPELTELVSQAATYARALNDAFPLRQFSLVIGYDHVKQELRFLVFHAGGVTSCPPLNPTDPAHYPDILRLFLSLLTWKSNGDAGLPEWCNEDEVWIQRDRDDREGILMRIKEVYYNRLGVRGRGCRVARLTPSSSSPRLDTPVAHLMQTVRRSTRIASKASNSGYIQSLPTKLASKSECAPTVMIQR